MKLSFMGNSEIVDETIKLINAATENVHVRFLEFDPSCCENVEEHMQQNGMLDAPSSNDKVTILLFSYL